MIPPSFAIHVCSCIWQISGQLCLLGLVLAVTACSLVAQEEPISPAQIQFFESKVRPLLIEHCTGCHGAEKQKGELRLDTRAGVFEGGAAGAAVVPGDLAESLLVQAVNYDGLEMPPAGKLPAEKIKILTDWVTMGAPWPAEAPTGQPARTPRNSDGAWTMEDRGYWAFQPVRKPALPELGSGKTPASAIDAFLLAKLEADEIDPNGPATPGELVRRLFYDLTGLPPTLEELNRWTSALSEGLVPGGQINEAVYRRLVDELLARMNQPLIATSANISGLPTCRSGIEVFGVMDGRVDLVLDGGPSHGVGATTVDITEPTWQIIREGTISAEEIANCLN